MDDTQLHKEFCTHGLKAKEALRKCALMLPEIERRSIWKKKGYESIYEYARIFAGMSGHAVDEALRVLRHAKELPALQKVIETRGINAVKPVIAIATPATDEFWAEKAESMSKNALEVYVREIKNQEHTQNEAEKFPRKFFEAESNTASVTMILPKDLTERLTKLKGNGEWEDLMNELLNYREQALREKQPEEKVTDSRHIPAGIVRFVLDRSRGLCEFGTCAKPYEILHHTQRFALEKVHDPQRIVALCKAHERIVHLGLIENEKIPAAQWQVVSEADIQDERYFIDRAVQKYRRPG